MDPGTTIVIVLVSLLVFGMLVLASAALWGSLAQAAFKRSKSPWRNFGRDAERLHKMVHPEERDKDK